MKDRENLMDTEIKLLQEAGRRYGLMLDRLRREKRDRTRMEARRAIETAMRKHGPLALAAEARARGISYGELVSRTTAREQQEIIDRWNAGRAERIKTERAAEAVKEAPVKRRKKKKK